MNTDEDDHDHAGHDHGHNHGGHSHGGNGTEHEGKTEIELQRELERMEKLKDIQVSYLKVVGSNPAGDKKHFFFTFFKAFSNNTVLKTHIVKILVFHLLSDFT